MLVEDEISSAGKFKLTDEHIRILEEEREKHVNGKSNSYGWGGSQTNYQRKKKVINVSTWNKAPCHPEGKG